MKDRESSPPEDRRTYKGRGAVHNPEGRFERLRFVRDEDLPHDPDDPAGHCPGEPPRVATTVIPEVTRTILARNDSPDIPFDRSINPYKGCEHGCVYCFARPTHSYLGLSPGLDFETRIFSKPEAPRLLAEELRSKNYRCDVIALGANTDPYQPVERELRLTRGILEVLVEHRHPVSVVTKSALVLRDLDLLAPMAADGLANVFVSITTLDPSLASIMEPRAAAPARRLETLRALADAGVPVGVLASPMIPGVNDAEMERILEASTRVGARWANYIVLRLPGEVREIFTAWLQLHFPDRAAKVLNLLREMHGGEIYDATFGKRMRGEGPVADLLKRRFDVATRRLGLNVTRPALDCSRFQFPPRRGDQGSLFPATS